MTGQDAEGAGRTVTASRARRRFLAVAIGASLFLGTLETVQVYVRSATEGRPMSWAAAFALTLPRWLILGLLAPGVAAMTARFPPGRAPRFRTVTAHAAAAVLFALLHLAACVVVYGFIIEGQPNQFPERLSKLLTVYLAGDVLVYAAVVGVLTALRLAGESRDRAVQASRLEARLSEARLDALRAQREPHFLFNTLNATSVLAMKSDHDGVVRTLDALGDLLRATLDPALPREVPLARELALLARYAAIQSVRFGDRFMLREDVAGDARAALVPSMILQPLVENAVRHGIEARPGPGCVTIRARREGAELRLEVRDTGPGFTAAAAAGREGIGLANTRARLAELYGGAERVDTGNLGEGGAFVSLRIPWRTVNGDAS